MLWTFCLPPLNTNYCLDLRLPLLCTRLHEGCQSSLLHWPNAFGFFYLLQGLIPLCELLGQQEHLKSRSQVSVGWTLTATTHVISCEFNPRRRIKMFPLKKHKSTDWTCNDENSCHPVEQSHVPFCCTPQKASSLPGTEPPFGPMKERHRGVRTT